MKKCIACLQELEEDKFYTKSNQCKKCKGEIAKPTKKKYNEKNREKIRKQVHENYLKNRDSVLERTKKYRQENYDKFKQYWKKSNLKHKEHRRARKILNYHVEKGNIKKPEACEMCNEINKVQAHHEDYNFALSVKWLCTACHGKLHRGIK